MLPNRAGFVFLVLSFLPLIAVAQEEEEEPTTGSLTVRTTPPGALVKLYGDILISGVTPTSFETSLIGDYKMVVEAPGYERHTTRVNLDIGKQEAIEITLSPKTRFKAGLRSLFIPGWGQMYSGHNVKAGVFLAVSAGTVVGFFNADANFQDKFDILEERENAYDTDPSPDNYLKMVSATRDAADAEDRRNIMIGVVAGVWALNLLDAVVLFPDRRGEIVVEGVGVMPVASPNQFGLVFTKRF